jgi:antitoxin component YwqK of YwqJK toxin-antitoxin module
MKQTLLIITALMLIVGCSESDAQTYQFANGFHDNGMVKEIKYHKKTRDGIELVKGETYYSSGQKESEGTYKNGKKDGKWTRWHRNGQKYSETTFKDGKYDGKYTTWYENGQKREEGTFKDGSEGPIESTSWDKYGNKK